MLHDLRPSLKPPAADAYVLKAPIQIHVYMLGLNYLHKRIFNSDHDVYKSRLTNFQEISRTHYLILTFPLLVNPTIVFRVHVFHVTSRSGLTVMH